MKRIASKKINKFMSIILCLVLLTSMIPQFGTVVYAEGPGTKYIGADYIGSNANTPNLKVVNIGGTSWLVIGYDGEGALSSAGEIVLFADDILTTCAYNDPGDAYYTDYEYTKEAMTYKGSTLQTTLDQYVNDNFTAGEIESIIPRQLEAMEIPDYYTHDEQWWEDNYHTIDKVPYEGVNALAWPLSAKEAQDYVPQFIRMFASEEYWLRTLGCAEWLEWDLDYWYPPLMATVNTDGKVTMQDWEREDLTDSHGVRPAIKLKKDNIVLTTEVENKEWKLTLKDRAHANFIVDNCEYVLDSNGNHTISYQNAVPGDNEYISYIIQGADGSLVKYQECDKVTSASGTATLTGLPKDANGKIVLEEGQKLYVFNEQKNGDDKSDYSSPLIEIGEEKGHDWAFDKFEWTGEPDYTSVKATYYCAKNKAHTASIDANLAKVTTVEPTCDAEGRIEYTASISADKALDGMAQQEVKEGRAATAPHKWKFTGFDWTGDYENGYTAAVANYQCENYESHTTKADAVITSKVVKPDIGKDGKTVYSATVSAADSPDEKRHTESRDAQPTKLGKFTVTFNDGMGNTLKTEEVWEGYPATAPEEPTRQYFKFDGWDKDFSKITEDLTVSAKWITYDVTIVLYKDIDARISSHYTWQAGNGFTLPGPSEVDIPQGYRFVAWGVSDTPGVSGDVVYKHPGDVIVPEKNVYIFPECKAGNWAVTFVNYDDTVLGREIYRNGTSANEIKQPGTPTKPGDAQYSYVFKGWTPELEDVYEDKTYKAVYDQVLTKHKVQFVNDDGTVISEKEYEYGTKAANIEIPTEAPTKAADAQYTYTFAGWDRQCEDVTGPATYTATYGKTINQYTISFDAAEGTGNKDSETLDFGTSYTLPSAEDINFSAPSGKYFAGWSLKMGDAEKVVMDEGESFELTADAVLTARWGGELKVSFDMSWIDAQAPEDITVVSGRKIEEPAKPKDAGDLKFGGWCKDASLETPWDFENDRVTEDITLYAKWVHRHDGVTFDPWMATDSMPQKAGSYYLLNDVTLADTWRLPDVDSESEMNLCLNGKTLRMTAEDGNAIEVTANWNLSIYDENNEGKITGAPDAGIDIEGDAWNGKYAQVNLHGGWITGNNWSGVRARGWGKFYMYGGIVSENISENGAGINGSTDAYPVVVALYGGQIVNNTAYRHGGGVYVCSDGSYGTSSTLFIGGENTGAEALIIKDNQAWGDVNNIELDRNYLSKVYAHIRIEGNLAEGSEIGVTKMDRDNLNPGKENVVTGNLQGNSEMASYFFSDMDHNSDYFPYELIINSNGELAFVKVYTLGLYPGEGTGEVIEEKVLDQKEFTLPENPFTAPENGYFDSWKMMTAWMDDEEAEFKKPGDVIKPDSDWKITAQWKYNVHQISFDANGGTGTMEPVSSNEKDGSYTLPESGFTAPSDAVVFNGWKIGDTGEIKQPGDVIKVTEDITLVANWSKLLTVTFDPGDGSGEIDSMTVVEGRNFELPENNFTAPEYREFDGWKLPGSTDILQPGNQVAVNEDTTITAQWISDYYFNIRVEGIYIDGDNYKDVLGDLDGDAATVVYDPHTNTLTLNNATIEAAKNKSSSSGTHEYGIYASEAGGDFNIVLIGENKIVNKVMEDGEGSNIRGIYIRGDDFSGISGDGSLTIDFTENGDACPNSYGILCSSSVKGFPISGSDVTVKLSSSSQKSGVELYNNTCTVSLKDGASLKVNCESKSGAALTDAKLIVEEGSTAELVSNAKAFKRATISDDTKSLGALVNTAASKDGAEFWDKETDISTYKYVRIPYSVDKDALKQAIEDAKSAMDGIATAEKNDEVECGTKYTTSSERNALEDAIKSAQAVIDDQTAAQPAIDAETEALKAAIDTYNKAIKEGGKHNPGTPVNENEVAATCTTAGGYDTVTYCTLCNKKLSSTHVNIPAIGHDWGEWETVLGPTETEHGSERRVCKNDPEHIETHDIPALNHVHGLTYVEAVAPTCTETGTIEYWICDSGDNPCGRYFKDEAGTERITSDELTVPANGHTEGEAKIENVVEATCEAAGSYDEYVYCSVCNKELKHEHKVEPAIGHDWGEWETTKEPTEEEKGEETRVCKHDANHIETRPIDKLEPKDPEPVNPEPADPDPKDPEDPEDPAPTPSRLYINTAGDGNVWTKGSGETCDFTFKRTTADSLTFSHFIGIEIDGKSVDSSNYTADQGSVIVKLRASYMETLSVGMHTITALFNDGNNPTAEFEIVRQADEPSDKPADDPSDKPTDEPSDKPTDEPSDKPTDEPTDKPADEPSDKPTDEPSDKPTDEPSDKPADEPSDEPTDKPADEPSDEPTDKPADEPTDKPVDEPNDKPSDKPTPSDTSKAPTNTTPSDSSKATSDTNANAANATAKNVPKTGDTENLVIWVMLAALALAIICASHQKICKQK